MEADRIIIRRISWFLFTVSEIRSLAALERQKSRIRAAFCFALLYTEPYPRRRICNSTALLALDPGGPFSLYHTKIRNTFAWPSSCYFARESPFFTRFCYHTPCQDLKASHVSGASPSHAACSCVHQVVIADCRKITSVLHFMKIGRLIQKHCGVVRRIVVVCRQERTLHCLLEWNQITL
jgi:hypothetical protein